MTLNSLLITALHALPVVLVGLRTRSKNGLIFIALVMAAVAVVFGHPGYSFLDLMAVALAYFVMVDHWGDRTSAKPDS